MLDNDFMSTMRLFAYSDTGMGLWGFLSYMFKLHKLTIIHIIYYIISLFYKSTYTHPTHLSIYRLHKPPGDSCGPGSLLFI